MRAQPRRGRTRRWPGRAVASVSALAIGAAGLAAASPAHAAEGCEVEYTVVNEWSTGFTANVAVTNLGDPIDGWELEWDFPGDQQVGNGWNGSYSQSGQHVTVTDAGYNATLGTSSSVQIGFNGTYSGSNEAPAEFTLNGVVCDGSTGGGDDGGGDDGGGDDGGGDDGGGDDGGGDDGSNDGGGDDGSNDGGSDGRVDNPFVGADLYVNPVWSEKAAGEPGGDAVADESTALWLDRIGAIAGNDSPTTGDMGLRDHLDEALAQAGDRPMTIQVVIYNLPGRDCAALASHGELGQEEIGRYKTEYIDVIAGIMDDEKYSDLRIVTIIEPDSLPNLVTNVGSRETATENCNTMKENGNYVEGVAYALSELGDIPNVYNYMDAGHHGWLGWDTNLGPSVQVFHEAATSHGATVDDLHGFAVNTANYSALVEPHFDVNDTVGGQQVRQSNWVDWNQYIDEQSFAQALRQEAVSAGFNSDIGMLIDTSRNGWGGSERPDGPSSSTDLNTFVDESRVDRRIHPGNWCNQDGAGLGERPQAAPASGIDAYTWIKPPGESDGNSEPIDNDEGKGFDRMCDPTYEGNVRNGNSPSGAMANAPVSGHWFPEQFQMLVENAYPPL
ncbi:cellulose 1,4-beta-cellobiosidase [Streptomonospora sp. PA3]|uniref:glycoside hydrolase family 6 protein n=1 Tax=Streptomonospora sp. PA3 TaxID=2607326 RepID=UPI0012DDAF2E|nr:glycoside hydrolase family 6 protein [Streptomonospora sp. PA3]MUL41378.1 cellulose 1,4-beta-cellobiosidase [Streptomonospora sp. PA3]